MGKEIPMIGERFGKLTVIERAPNNRRGQAMWICKCDCGENSQPIIGTSLRSGKTHSCGCLNIKHHKRGTRLYKVWRDMKYRCYNPSAHLYERYGGRGIAVCDEWRNDFQAFYDWAMSNGYKEDAKRGECTIDRIYNNGNYEPSNCRWVSHKEQQDNKENTIKVFIGGVEKTLHQISDEFGIGYYTLFKRYQNGLRGNELVKELDTKKSENARRKNNRNDGTNQTSNNTIS